MGYLWDLYVDLQLHDVFFSEVTLVKYFYCTGKKAGIILGDFVVILSSCCLICTSICVLSDMYMVCTPCMIYNIQATGIDMIP